MPDWVKILLSLLSGAITGAGAVAASNGSTKTAILAGIIGASTAVVNLHVQPPGKS